jgi:hypothetical protein
VLGETLPAEHEHPVLGIKTTQAFQVSGGEWLPQLDTSDLGGEAARERVYFHRHESFLRDCCPSFR